MRKILIIKKIHDSGIQLLNRRKDYSYEIIENLETDFLKNKLRDCDAISLRTSKFTKELIESSPKLKVISRHGVGYDNVDLIAAKNKNIVFTSDIYKLRKCTIFIVTVPTPIYKNKKPNLSFLKQSCELISKIIKKNDLIIFESTVYPGVTENICAKVIEKKSKLIFNKDF